MNLASTVRLAILWMALTLVSCLSPEAPEDPATVSTRLVVTAVSGYTLQLKDQAQTLALPWKQETTGTLDFTLVATPDTGQPEPVWYVEFPEEHVATYHRRELSIRLYKSSVTVRVEAETTP